MDHVVMSTAKVWATKLGIAFFMGFLPPFLLGILGVVDGISDTGNFDGSTAVWVSLIFGAVAAGIRAILVPLNITATDKLIGPRQEANSVTVTTTPPTTPTKP